MLIQSNMFSQASGSVGGSTAARNRYGQYFRSRIKGVNPRSVLQTAVRAILALLSQAWQSLTDAQRAGWKSFAENTPRTNKLGATVVLSGNAAYTAANAPRLQAGLERVDDAPTSPNRPAHTLPAVEITNDTQVQVTPVSGDQWLVSGDKLAVYVGREVAPTVNYYGGPWKYADLVTASGTTGVDDPWGDISHTGNRKFIATRVLGDAGELGTRQQQPCVISL